MISMTGDLVGWFPDMIPMTGNLVGWFPDMISRTDDLVGWFPDIPMPGDLVGWFPDMIPMSRRSSWLISWYDIDDRRSSSLISWYDIDDRRSSWKEINQLDHLSSISYQEINQLDRLSSISYLEINQLDCLSSVPDMKYRLDHLSSIIWGSWLPVIDIISGNQPTRFLSSISYQEINELDACWYFLNMISMSGDLSGN